MAAYESAKDQQGVIDFEDVLLLLAAMLAERRDVADSVREQYQHFVVDEYQDVSPLQQYLLDQWLGGRQELCVVGDPSQTIYSFAGASAHHLTSFTPDVPARAPRSSSSGTTARPRRWWAWPTTCMHASRKAGGPAPLELRAQRPDGPDVSYATYADDEAEAAGVTDAIATLVRGGVSRRRDRGAVPDQRAVGGVRGGAGRPGHRATRCAGTRGSSRARTCARRWCCCAAARAPRTRARRCRSPSGTSCAARAGPTRRRRAGARARERWDALQALVSLADALAAAPPTGDGPPTVADLVAELDERAAAQHAPTVEGVTLASLHAAKGLEWDAVFLVGLSDGLLPTVQAQTDAAVAEERRLLYVGITRAREHLQLSYSRARHPRAPGEPRRVAVPHGPVARRAPPAGRPAARPRRAPAGGGRRA